MLTPDFNEKEPLITFTQWKEHILKSIMLALHKDRKTERQKDRKTERQKDRKTERKKDRKTERKKERKTKTERQTLMTL